MKNVQTYKDYDRNTVEIGDRIATVDILTGEMVKDLGVVTEIQKSGYIVLPLTTVTGYKAYVWGRHTRKMN